MRVLHIPNYYRPHIGGIEVVAEDVVNSLKDSCEQKIICFKDAKGTVKEDIDGINITRVGCIAKIRSQSIAPSYGKELKRIMNEFNPDVVVFHYPNPYVARQLLKYKKRNFKLILYWHLDITKQKILGKLFEPQTKALLERANKIVCTSPNYIEGSKFVSKYKSKAMYIPNCVGDDVDIITPEVKEISNKIKEENKNKTIIFALGRHVPYKGMIHLVNASKYLDNSFEVFIAGQGPLTESLKEASKDDKKVHFLGRVSRDELKAYLDACDIFAFPSETKNEAFGIALAEAMALGKPSVIFTIPGSGVNYVSLNGVTGIEVENSNDKAYAEALVKLANDPSLRKKYGQEAKNRCNTLFRFNSLKKSINDLIEELSVCVK